MRIAYRWLKEYVKTDTTAEQVGERFRNTSSDVESITNWEERLSSVVVGLVEKVQNHPQSERLHIAQVNIGKKAALSIVCGAPNLREGQKVAVALPGAVVFSNKDERVKIEPTKIRGITSAGMLCAALELGLPGGGGGIMELDPQLRPGTPLAKALLLDDTVLDLEITPNRPDLLSYRGLARELTAIEKSHLLDLPIYHLDRATEEREAPFSVSIEDSRLCPRYTAICLENVRLAASPPWLQARLILSGLRPINTIVDITNYVMLETGQPLHAFDLDRIENRPPFLIRVRSAHPKEEVRGLDGSVRKLKGGDILIADTQSRPLALAGIMGGESTAIQPNTKRILLESACFNGAQIRRTSRWLGLRTEASTRFEKGLDPEQTVTALKRALYLLKEIAGAEVGSPLVDCYPKARPERPRIHLSFTQVQQVLGVHISPPECKSILQHLGFQIPSLTKSSFEAIPPSWRKDVTIPEDIIEELVRIWGIDRLPSTLPQGAVTPPEPNTFFNDKQLLRRVLAGLGLHETVHLSFTSLSALEKTGFKKEEAIRLESSLSQETEYLIPSHLIHFLENCGGVNQSEMELKLFEVGHVFSPPKEEKELLSIILRSNRPLEEQYREAKTILRRLWDELDLNDGSEITAPEENRVRESYYQPESDLTVYCQGKAVGRMGSLSPSLVSSYKIRRGRNLLFLSLNLDLLLNLPGVHHPYQLPPVYPSVERDLTVIAPKQFRSGELTAAIEAYLVKHPLILAWEVTTIYQGKPLLPEEKSITLHFVYNGKDHTLSDQEVGEVEKGIIKYLKEKLPLRLV